MEAVLLYRIEIQLTNHHLHYTEVYICNEIEKKRRERERKREKKRDVYNVILGIFKESLMNILHKQELLD